MEPLELERRYCAANYDPLPVVLVEGRGAWVRDDGERWYLDMMSAYSAVSLGHSHPRLVAALRRQAERLAVVSRAFHSDRLGPFLARACGLTGLPTALPTNTGAEAVETALKAARKWAYNVKGVAPEQAEIIVCTDNFHGRSITIVGFSSDPQSRAGFGPFPAGFRQVPYGDPAALEAAITPNTAAFLVEPIQGEAGVIVPPAGYLRACSEICRRENVLLLMDEVQTGLGRTGAFLASDHEGVRPDGLMLGKALGGGLYPVSLFLAREDLMGVFGPGDHGSTFGGNPLAAAVGLEALDVVIGEGLVERSAALGAELLKQLQAIDSPVIRDVRGRGLFIGLEVEPAYGSGRAFCERLLHHGVLTKETREHVIRLAPPLVVSRDDLDWAVERITRVVREREHEDLMGV